MKAVFSLLAMVLLAAFFFAFPVGACWVGFSTEELVEQSDLIVIGTIKGISGTEKEEGAWRTYWEVDAEYFLKGDAASSLLFVATPGAKNEQPSVSTQYDLDAWGDTVLLFLVERRSCFEPLSPQGVIALSSPGSPRQEEVRPSYAQGRFVVPGSPRQGEITPGAGDSSPRNKLCGEYLLQKYGIVDEKMPGEDKKELENYIAGLPKILAATSEIAGEGSGGQSQAKSPSSLGITGGADGPNSIYVSGNPLKAALVPAIIFAAIIFTGGFALGYITKARR